MKNRLTGPAGLQARAKAASAGTRAAQNRVVVVRPVVVEVGEGEDVERQPVSAELWLYGTVGGYWWGFDSDDVADALRAMGDVEHLTVRLHSFGGSAIEGIAIANLLANHPATTLIVIDGIAASAATQIALAGDELVMSPGSQFMVHDAWMCVCGNAGELRAEADWLDKQSQNYAETYAHRAGGTAAEWRERMLADNGEGTWFTAAEAVEAGLAARVANIASTTPPPPVPSLDELDEDDEGLSAAASYDLEVLLSPAARTAMSNWRPGAPKPPAASADGSTTTRTKETAMAFTPEQLTQMRQDLGLAETADEATIVAALSEALAEQATDPVAAPTTPTVPEGMSLVTTEVLDQLRNQAQQGSEARAQQLTEHRDRVLTQAVATGRIAPSQRDHFATLWQADASGTEALINQLAAGLVPVVELGHAQPPATDTTAAVDDGAIATFAQQLGLTQEDLRG